MRESPSRLADDMRGLAEAIGRRVQLMEVCGTHTVSIFRNGIRTLLPETVRLVSGPGCPVCVTAQRHIDAAIQLGSLDDVVVATYGDMVRVPGRLGSLESQRARGAILRADEMGLVNFSVLAAHKLVIPAMKALLDDGDVPLDGFLCPGHVSVIIGSDAYQPIVEKYHVPCVVAGFEPVDVMFALIALLKQVRDGAAQVENPYAVAVKPQGNETALRLLERVFVVSDAPWRALGVIEQSGLELRPEYKSYDALERFGIMLEEDQDPEDCRCGEVIQGKVTPEECSLFGTVCTPTTPVGPCMVSSEGTCSAWFKYGRK
jgi:hydrogenase expression/formation protein HypD